MHKIKQHVNKKRTQQRQKVRTEKATPITKFSDWTRLFSNLDINVRQIHCKRKNTTKRLI